MHEIKIIFLANLSGSNLGLSFVSVCFVCYICFGLAFVQCTE